MNSIFAKRLYRFDDEMLQRLDEEEFTVQPKNHAYDATWHDPAKDKTDAETDHLFDVFKQSYEKSVGSSHDRDWFDRRAKNWVFYGTIDAGVAVRKQNPEIDEIGDDGKPTGNKVRKDLWRFTASYGNLRGVIDGAKEFQAAHGNEPVWAVLTPKLGALITRKSDGQFFQAPKPFVKALYPVLTQNGSNYLAGQIKLQPDGTLLATTPAGEEIEKIVVLNKAYVESFYPQYKDMFDEILQHPDDPLYGKLLEIYMEAVKSGDFKKATEEAFAEAVGDILSTLHSTGALKGMMDYTDRLQNHIVSDVEKAQGAWDSFSPGTQRAIKRLALGVLRSASPETREWLKTNYEQLRTLFKMMKDPDWVEPPPVRNPFADASWMSDDSEYEHSDGIPPGPDERDF